MERCNLVHVGLFNRFRFRRVASNVGGQPRALARRTLLWSSVLGAALSVSGCLAPTLPLPPPSRPEISSPDSFGDIRIKGTVRAQASVYAQNERTNDIAGKYTDETGQYDFKMQAAVGDRIRVWQSINTEQSDVVVVVVPSAADDNSNFGGAAGE
jgi:hypothetical protein